MAQGQRLKSKKFINWARNMISPATKKPWNPHKEYQDFFF